jgi:hypothetical protein
MIYRLIQLRCVPAAAVRGWLNWLLRHIEAAAIIVAFWFVLGPVLGMAQSVSEDQVKAAYLFNFAKFVEWPAEPFIATGSPITFCTLGRTRVADELDSSVRGKSIDGHVILIKHLRRLEDFKECRLVFLASSAGEQQQKLLQAAKGFPVLLVAETPGFTRAGGTINFITENGRLIIEVNVNAAESAHLKISSKLLALARILNSGAEKQGQ